jgi:hypothetical protein
VIGWLIAAALMGAASVLRFVALSRYPHTGSRTIILANAIARASIVVSFVLIAFGAPDAVAGLFFVVGVVIVVGTPRHADRARHTSSTHPTRLERPRRPRSVERPSSTGHVDAAYEISGLDRSSVRTVKRFAIALDMRWLFLVILVGWIIATIVVAFQGKWGKVAWGLAYVVGFGLLHFVIPRGVPRLLRQVQSPESN